MKESPEPALPSDAHISNSPESPLSSDEEMNEAPESPLPSDEYNSDSPESQLSADDDFSDSPGLLLSSDDDRPVAPQSPLPADDDEPIDPSEPESNDDVTQTQTQQPQEPPKKSWRRLDFPLINPLTPRVERNRWKPEAIVQKAPGTTRKTRKSRKSRKARKPREPSEAVYLYCASATSASTRGGRRIFLHCGDICEDDISVLIEDANGTWCEQIESHELHVFGDDIMFNVPKLDHLNIRGAHSCYLRLFRPSDREMSSAISFQLISATTY